VARRSVRSPKKTGYWGGFWVAQRFSAAIQSGLRTTGLSGISNNTSVVISMWRNDSTDTVSLGFDATSCPAQSKDKFSGFGFACSITRTKAPALHIRNSGGLEHRMT